ncbi:MAG: Ig-like domain repeat protein [Endomicrobiia bacterium]|nr:Ig-like domain repeat protein [Endomicrobiia bacterium]
MYPNAAGILSSLLKRLSVRRDKSLAAGLLCAVAAGIVVLVSMTPANADYWWGNRMRLIEQKGIEGYDNRGFSALGTLNNANTGDRCGISFTARVSSGVQRIMFPIVQNNDTDSGTVGMQLQVTLRADASVGDVATTPSASVILATGTVTYDVYRGIVWADIAMAGAGVTVAGNAYWIVVQDITTISRNKRLVGGDPVNNFYPSDTLDNLDDPNDQDTDMNLGYKFYDNDNPAMGWVAQNATPIFLVTYKDNTTQGNPYYCMDQNDTAAPNLTSRAALIPLRAIYSAVAGNFSHRLAQLFVPEQKMNVNKIKLTIRTVGGTPSEPLQMRIIRVSDGAVMLSSTTVVAAATYAAWTEVELAAFNGVELAAGTQYRLEFMSPGGSATIYWRVLGMGTQVANTNVAYGHTNPSTPHQIKTFQEDASNRGRFIYTTNSGGSWSVEPIPTVNNAAASGYRTTNPGYVDLHFNLYWDNTLPTFGIAQPDPTDVTWRKSLPAISGTASDNISMHSTQGAWLFIKDETFGKRWTGAYDGVNDYGWTDWSEGDESKMNLWISTGVTGSDWELFTTTTAPTVGSNRPLYLRHDRKYTVYVKTMDSAKNMSGTSYTSLLNNPGSNSGSWSNPGAVYDNDTSTASSATNGQTHTFGGYGFSVPLDVTIDKVVVRADVLSAAGSNNGDGIKIEVSENGGTSWLGDSWTMVNISSTSQDIFYIDVTTWTTWSPAKLNGDNIKVRVTQVQNGTQDATYLDWLPVYVDYYFATSAQTSQFYFDMYDAGPPERPDSYCTLPVGATYFAAGTPYPFYGDISQVKGTARDNDRGTVQFVRWILWRQDGQWWNGSGWQSAGSFPTNPTNWLPSSRIPKGGGSVNEYASIEWFNTTLVPSKESMTEVPQGTTYYITERAEDAVKNAAGSFDSNLEVVRSTIAFRWDSGIPYSTFTFPTPNIGKGEQGNFDNPTGIVAVPPDFTGVMSDALSGIDTYDPIRGAAVQVAVQRLSDGNFWTGAGFVDTGGAPSWRNVTSVWVSSWSWTHGITFTSGKYLISSRARDKAKNTQDVFNVWESSQTVEVDADPPTSAITLPSVHNRYYGHAVASKNLAAISGTSADNKSGDKVFVRLQDITRGTTYWSAAEGAWVAYSTWSSVAWGSPSWTLTGFTLTSTNKYGVECKALDAAGNPEADPAPPPTTRSREFYYDAAKPTSTVTSPANNLVTNSIATIAGTSDNDRKPAIEGESGMDDDAGVQLQVTRGDDGLAWDQTRLEWTGDITSTSAWNTASKVGGVWNNWDWTPNSGMFNLGTDDFRIFRVRPRAKDKAYSKNNALDGNREFDSIGDWPGAYVTVTYDPTNPESFIQYPGAGDTRLALTQSLVTISGTCQDNFRQRTAGGVALNVWRDGSSYFYNGTAWADAGSVSGAENSWVNIENFAGNYNYSFYTVTIDSDSASWWIRISSNQFTDGQVYRARSRARDTAGNYDAALSTRSFTCDRTPPVAAMTLPPNNSYRNEAALLTISGTCNAPPDVPASVDYLKFKIYYSTGGPGSVYYWQHNNPTEGQWTKTVLGYQTVTSLDGGSPQVWYYTNSALTFETDYEYTVDLWVKDKADNQQTFGYSFRYDITRPTTSITMPFQSVHTSMPTISGYAGDKTAGFAGTGDSAQIRIRDIVQGATYWNWNGNWTTSADSWADAVWYSGVNQNTVEWRIYGNTPYWPPWSPDNDYQVIVRAKDRAGNISNVYSSSTFRIDNVGPDTFIQKPGSNDRKLNFNANGGASLATISGTARDTSSNLGKVEIMIRDLTRGATYWSAFLNQWVNYSTYGVYATVPSVSPPASDLNWYYEMPINQLTGGNKYEFSARAYDVPGNADDTPDAKTNILVDFTIPQATIDTPFQNQIVKAGFATITGTTTDPLDVSGNRSGMESLRLRLIKTSPPIRYWWSDNWQTDPPGSNDQYPEAPAGSWVEEPPGSGIYIWTYNFTGAWTDNAAYTLETYPRDDSRGPTEVSGTGNKRLWGDIRTFFYDQSPPRSRVTDPTNSGYKNQVWKFNAIQGTADDNISSYAQRKVSKVLVNIIRKSPSPMKVWGGSAWDTNPPDPYDTAYWHENYFVGATSGAWVYPNPLLSGTTPTWVHGEEYDIISKAIDAAGNYEAGWSTTSFTYDEYQPETSEPPTETERPNTRIAYPPDDYHTKDFANLLTLSGTAYENPPIGKVKDVRILLRMFFAGSTWYWVGNNWNAYADQPVSDWPSALPTDGQYNQDIERFYYEISEGAYTEKENRVFAMTVAGQDFALNWELVRPTHTYVYDTIRPTATITYPAASPNNYISQTGKIYGAAVDSYPGKVNLVEIRVKDLRYSTTYFVGGVWQDISAESAWNQASLSSGGTFWILNNYDWTTDVTYEANVRVQDKATNWGLNYATRTFIADFTPPTVAVNLPPAPDGQTVQGLPTVSGTALDAPPGSIERVEVAYQKTDAPARWWDGGGWNSVDPVYFSTTYSSPAWSRATGNPWVNNTNYKVRAVAYDRAQISSSTERAFYFQIPAPAAVVTFPVNNSHYPAATINQIRGTAETFSEYAELSIQDLTQSSTYWSGALEQWVDYSTWTRLTVTSGDWAYDTTPSWWTSNKNYKARIKATAAGQTGDPEANPATFVIDDAAPSNVNILRPLHNNHYNATTKQLATISGTVSDANSLGIITKLEVRIQTGSNYAKFYSTWTEWIPAADTWNNTDIASLPDFKIAVPTGTWTNNTTYNIRARATDKAVNVYTQPSDTAFVYDVTLPTATVSNVSNDVIYSALPTIEGTAWDASPGSVDRVEIQIRNDSDTLFFRWTGSDWATTGVSTWAVVSGVAPWSRVSPTWANEKQYTVRSRAVDKATNQQSAWVTGSSSFTFRFDNSAPVSGVSSISEGQRLNPALALTITGTASDNLAGISEESPCGVSLQLKRITQAGATFYWDGGAWQSSGPVSSIEFEAQRWLSATGIWDSYSIGQVNLPSDEYYNVKVRAIDLAVPAGNQSVYGSGVNFAIDKTTPVARIVNPPDAGFSKTGSLATVSGTAYDWGGNNYVRVKADQLTPVETLGIVPWHTAQGGIGAGTVVWTSTWSPTGGGWQSGRQYRVWAQAYDAAGNVQSILSSSTFIVDDDPPAAALTQPTDLSNWNTLLTISGTSVDVAAYVSTVTVAIEKLTGVVGWWNGSDFTGGSRQDFAANISALPVWTYTGFAGALADNQKYKLYVRASDVAGNETADIAATFTIDTATPTSRIISPQEGKFYPSLASITGTASDPNANASRVTRVELRIHDIDTNKDWNTTLSQWGNAGQILRFNLDYAAAEPLNWSWNSSVVDWVDGNRYLIETRARDRALKSNDGGYTGNWQIDYSTVGFRIDKTTPTAGIVIPLYDAAVKTYSSMPTITGTAADATSGIKEIKIVVRDVAPGKGVYWKGTYLPSYGDNWQDEVVRLPVTGTVEWSTAAPQMVDNNRYRIWVEVEDNAGNKLQYNVPSEGGYEYRFDDKAPTSRVTYPLAGALR